MVKYAETTDSSLPAETFSLRKSATLPREWLSRIPVVIGCGSLIIVTNNPIVIADEGGVDVAGDEALRCWRGCRCVAVCDAAHNGARWVARAGLGCLAKGDISPPVPEAVTGWNREWAFGCDWRYRNGFISKMVGRQRRCR